MYHVRTNTGLLYAKISAWEARKIMIHASGEWQEKNLTCGKTLCFVINSNFSYGTDDIMLFFFEGCYLHLVK